MIALACNCSSTPLYIALLSLVLVMVLGFIFFTREKPVLPSYGSRFIEVKEGEKNVSTKTEGNHQYLLDEDGISLDLKRISNKK